MLTKIEGNTITHRWALNIENVHEIEPECMDMQPGDAQIIWDFGLPTTGNCWVLSAITISFDLQPVLPGMLWVDSNAGATLWWMTFVGQTPAAVAGVPTAQGPYKFHFTPVIKFPVDEDVAINYIGGDPAVIFWNSWEIWQEQESCNGT